MEIHTPPGNKERMPLGIPKKSYEGITKTRIRVFQEKKERVGKDGRK